MSWAGRVTWVTNVTSWGLVFEIGVAEFVGETGTVHLHEGTGTYTVFSEFTGKKFKGKKGIGSCFDLMGLNLTVENNAICLQDLSQGKGAQGWGLGDMGLGSSLVWPTVEFGKRFPELSITYFL